MSDEEERLSKRIDDLDARVYALEQRGMAKKKPKAVYEVSVPEHLRTVEFTQAWGEFRTHRQQIRKPMTPLTEQKLMKAMSEVPVETAIAMIDQSIRNGWQGIFPLKENSNGKANGQGGGQRNYGRAVFTREDVERQAAALDKIREARRNER